MTTPAIDRVCALFGDDLHRGNASILTINRLLMLTLPAHLQLNHGQLLETTQRDALRAKLIRGALSGSS